MEADSLRELDEPSAALRLLLELSKGQMRFSIGKLCRIMSALGVGRTAVDYSCRALVGAGLAREDREKGGRNRTFTVLSITDRGDEVADKLLEIQSIMSRVTSND